MEAPDFFHDQTVDAFMASAASSAAAPAEPPPPSTDSNLVVMLPLANQDGAKDGHVLMMPVQMDYATMSQLLGDATSTTAQLMATVESLAAAGELEVTMSDSGPMISYKAPAPPPPAAPPAAAAALAPLFAAPPAAPAPAPAPAAAAAAPPPAPPQASAAAAVAAAKALTTASQFGAPGPISAAAAIAANQEVFDGNTWQHRLVSWPVQALQYDTGVLVKGRIIAWKEEQRLFVLHFENGSMEMATLPHDAVQLVHKRTARVLQWDTFFKELKRVDEVGAARKRAEAAQAARRALPQPRRQRRPYQGHARALAAAPVVSGAVLPDERLSAAALAEAQAAADATAEAAGLSACAIAILVRGVRPQRHHLSGHVSRREALHLPPAADATEDAEGEAFSRPPRPDPADEVADEPLPSDLPTMGGGALPVGGVDGVVAKAKAAGRAAAQAQAQPQLAAAAAAANGAAISAGADLLT